MEIKIKISIKIKNRPPPKKKSHPCPQFGIDKRRAKYYLYK